MWTFRPVKSVVNVNRACCVKCQVLLLVCNNTNGLYILLIYVVQVLECVKDTGTKEVGFLMQWCLDLKHCGILTPLQN